MLYELKLSSSLHKCLREENFWRMTVKDKHHKDSVEYIYCVDVFRGRLHESQGGFGDIHPLNRLVEVNEVYSGSIQEPL